MTNTQVVTLGSYDKPLNGYLFQALSTLTEGKVTSYRSDLYHDALWLDKQVSGEATFYYGLRETGTSIGMDADLVAQNNREVYRVTVYRAFGNAVWRASLERMV